MSRIHLVISHSRVLLFSANILTSIGFISHAHAAVSLELAAAHGLQGTVIEAGLNVVTDTDLAGFNAEIILPDGVIVDNVQLGDLLTPSESFGFAFAVDGQTLRVVAASGNDTFTGSGEILKLRLLLDAELLGLKELTFAETNPDPFINSQHAVSNADGSESLPHSFSNTSFLVFSKSSDYDSDGMPDEWEVEFGLDPLTDNADGDSDEDGFTDLEEYLGGSDPKDPGSTPDRIFGDGFEGGEEQ
jgi:hypothetical protein